MRTFITLGAINGFLAVALGAFAAHGLKSQLTPELLTVFHTGVQYHSIHAIALLFTGILGSQVRARSQIIAGWSFMLGIILFSGSLYLMVLSGARWLGMVTPFGGSAFLIGWLSLALAARSIPKSSQRPT